MLGNSANRLVLPALLLALAPPAWAGAGDSGSAAKQLLARVLGAAECAPTAEHECHAGCEDGYRASKELGSLLSKDPAAFGELVPQLRASFEQCDSGRQKVLGFLAGWDFEGCATLGDELFAAAPEKFSEAQMLALAEVGSGSIRAALLARLKNQQTESALPAAWFAFRGDAVGQATLARAAASPSIDADNAFGVLVSAGALTALGDQRALPAAQERVHAAVLAALDAGELERARSMALTAELLREPLEKAVRSSAGGYGAKVRVSPLENQLGWHLKQRGAQLAGADDVFELIERITPLS